MHLAADAVAAVASHDAELAVVARLGGVGPGLDRVRDVGEPVAGHHRGDARLHRLSGGLRQRLVDRDQRPDAERDRGVAMPAVEDRAAVDGHQIARRQHLACRRNAVHHTVIDRRADAGREAVVAEERRDAAAVADHGFGDLVELQRRHPRGGRLREPPRSADATSDPAAAIASSSPALRCATTLRLRSPGRPIIGSYFAAERPQGPGEHLVQRAHGVDGLQVVVA